MSRLILVMFFEVLVILDYAAQTTSSCNEAVCASIVSKCMLTQSCKCDLKNCTCCRDCYNCLDDLYYECCSCVEMCPKSNDTDINLGQTSHVGDLAERIPELFNALTEEQDNKLRWIAYSFPVHKDATFFTPKQGEIKLIPVMTVQDLGKMKEEIVNCTVAFMSQCTAWNKCKSACTSMGASSYRWFHDGCCECVGDTCLNYGMNTSKCLKCPDDADDEGDESDDVTAVESNETRDTDEDSSSNADANDAKKQTEAKETYHKEVTE